MKFQNFYSSGKQQRIVTEKQYQARKRVHELTQKYILDNSLNGLPMSFSEHLRLWLAVAFVAGLYTALFITFFSKP